MQVDCLPACHVPTTSMTCPIVLSNCQEMSTSVSIINIVYIEGHQQHQVSYIPELHRGNILHKSRINYAYLLIYMNISPTEYVCNLICTEVVHSSRLYT